MISWVSLRVTPARIVGMMITICTAMIVVSTTVFVAQAASTPNGFSLDGALVPVDEILHGGPPRDGIPALNEPKFVSAREATRMAPGERIIGVRLGDIVRAYPINILTWHELVNDRFGERAIVVSYCPLCGSGVVFDAQVGDQQLTFGVSGLLYNSDMLLYDRQSESLWSQLTHTAIAGSMVSQRLTVIPATHTTWSAWLQRYPETMVLSRDTGYSRDYDRSPYAGYENSPRLYFPTRHQSDARHPKEWVLGVTVNGAARAYPFPVMTEQGARVFTDELAGQRIEIHWDESSQTASVSDPDGNAIAATRLYWFAWYAFHPDTDVYRIGKRAKRAR